MERDICDVGALSDCDSYGGEGMKVKDLYPVISPYLDIQIGESKTDRPLTNKTWLANSNCEISTYEDEDIYALIPRIDKEGNAYLAILIETKA